MENVSQKELQIIISTIRKGMRALYTFYDIQKASQLFPEYNIVLSSFYHNVYTSSIETLLLQLSKLYLNNKDSANLQTLSSKTNITGLTELRTEFNNIKNATFNEKEFVEYRNKWLAHDDRDRNSEPDFKLPVEKAEKLLNFAYEYASKVGETIGIVYMPYKQEYNFTSFLTYVNLPKDKNHE